MKSQTEQPGQRLCKLWGLSVGALMLVLTPVWAQPSNRALVIKADVQEANANTGIITASGNVNISYPEQQVTATAQKATYFTGEQRIVLEGGVTITQRQNRLQAETVTYMVQQGTFQAKPPSGQQVQSIYVLPPEPSPTP